ncbi:MAG: gas vesicle protein GvpO [Actinomycetota bacterium]|nr:gas vesicle protein GvpO [Actinomycetota bacterium]
MALGIPELVDKAREQLAKLTGLELSTTLGAVKDEKGWHVTVEMIEKHSLPDGMDILAAYEALMDDNGKMLEFGRKGLRKRIDTEAEEVEE